MIYIMVEADYAQECTFNDLPPKYFETKINTTLVY